jgi:hypothetical protein
MSAPWGTLTGAAWTWAAWLLDASAFETRWHCVRDAVALGWTLAIANGLTWATYWAMAIPLVKVYRSHRHNVGAAWLLAGSAAFIVLCGNHHLLYVLAFRWPAYRISVLSDACMAATSFTMCVAFYMAANRICLMRPASEVATERDAKDEALRDAADAIREKDELIVRFSNVISDLRSDLAIYETYYDRDRLHRNVVTAIESLADSLPGGPADGNRDR